MKFLAWLKKDFVLVTALALAVISLCVVKPSAELVVSAIDFKVLALLFCLMLVIQAFRTTNLLDYIAVRLLGICKTTRLLYFILVFLVFFISMVITNDVALLTFVPLTILVCQKRNIPAGTLVVLETIAANLGSSLTPMGNPQNLFLYSFYNFSTKEFFSATLIIGAVSGVLLTVVLLLVGGNKKSSSTEVMTEFTSMGETQVPAVKKDFRFWLYVVAFVLSLLTVFRLVDYKITLVVVICIAAICNFRLLFMVDYGLLGTFLGFFVFVGCISSVPAVADLISKSMVSPFATYITGIATSQVISNVPASLLLSGFANYGKELLLAVNVGGLGTLIASLASVISFNIYRNSTANCCKESFMARFTGYNLLFLAVLAPVVWVVS
ncbi:MAG: SLC13 family permease [Treponema sp.]|nr:SLC13 family permease [Treponema sp.]